MAYPSFSRSTEVFRVIAFLLLFCFSFSSAVAENLRVAVASNFLQPAQSLIQQFEINTGVKIELISASSGKLYWQIAQGAPFDLFLSADKNKPQALVDQGLALTNSKQTYARGKLSLWLKSQQVCQNPTTSSLSILKQSNIRKIAIANPQLAPYGMASKRLLMKQHLWKTLKPKLIYPENIAQVAQLAKLGSVDAALVASSYHKRLTATSLGCFVTLAENDYPAIEQQLVIVARSKKKPLVKKLVAFILSKQGQDLINSMGYIALHSDKIPFLK